MSTRNLFAMSGIVSRHDVGMTTRNEESTIDADGLGKLSTTRSRAPAELRGRRRARFDATIRAGQSFEDACNAAEPKPTGRPRIIGLDSDWEHDDTARHAVAMNPHGMTIHEIAKLYGANIETIRLAEQNAIRRLKTNADVVAKLIAAY